MTDKIIEMLGRCAECERCEDVSFEDVIKLINLQKNEIERLEAEVNEQYEHINRQKAAIKYFTRCGEEWNHTLDRISEKIDTLYDFTRAEAIKEFAERLKEKERTAINCHRFEGVISTDDIDNLVKEMTEKGGAE